MELKRLARRSLRFAQRQPHDFAVVLVRRKMHGLATGLTHSTAPHMQLCRGPTQSSWGRFRAWEMPWGLCPHCQRVGSSTTKS